MVNVNLFPSSAPNFMITSGKGTNQLSPLVAFDAALINAGISDYNLVKISSILPAGAQKCEKITVNKGFPIWTAYSTVSSNDPGTILATAVSIGIPEDPNSVGVIMETSEIMNFHARTLAGRKDKITFDAKDLSEKLEAKIKLMTETAMKNHGIALKEILVSSAYGTIIPNLAGSPYLSLISAVCIW